MLFYVFNIHTDVNFPAEQWQSFASQNPLMIALASRTQSLDQVINMNPLFNPGGIGGANPYTLPGLYQNGQQPLDTFGLSGAMVSTNFVSFMKQKEKEVAKELSATATKVDDVKDEGNGFLNFLGDVGSGATKVGKGLLDFLILDDVNTLADKDASLLDKGIALASFIPIGKVLKIPKAIDKIVDSNVDELVKKSDVDEVVGKGAGDLGISKITQNSPKNVIFGELDNLGRPTGVTATITQDMIGTGSKASQSIKPPGFLGGGPGSPGHARGHLLGNQLGGSGKDARNLVTLFQTPVNSPVMRDFESSVRAVVEKGKVVRYQSIPIYEGNNLMPKGVTLKARGTNGFSLDVTVINMK
ncbi:DNA/RNA non-specific endonuclease [Solibacillus faecavium]|uniref:DNA/RNA non-specific endonuclease n=1 Tax=Solibacillus faecavium TaxID=2762221 RepID=UPI00296AC354|nr:DNA/RNA non-specific endonuclease [Solibacillus faecavium]